MKKLVTFVFAMLLTAGLSFAQTGGSTAPAAQDNSKTGSTDTSKKAHKGGKKAHKGGKKSKKGSSTDTTTTPPK